ncbi:MAG TPA: ubiquinol-cytochrome c reductase iron-sulfur subunit [Alphaproteobacteria bacterium]|nr:ubiquinol-cytochrome c reductase iron-sulfur subunit [Alphaproteobacteria bacterium]
MSVSHYAGHKDEVKRRDFLYLATAAMGVLGAAAAAWPFLDSMNASSDVLAAGGPLDVDLAPLRPGEQIVVRWRSRPIFIVNRSPEALKTLREPQLLSRLRDPNSEQDQQAKYATNWHRSIKPEYLVLVGICTHLGCIPEFHPKPGDPQLGADWLGGYFCPCHGSRYDLAGRVFQGVPAPYNLPVPPYRFVNDKTLRVGENPPGSDFDFESIEQI